jgi:hypothetical protein
LAEKEKEGGLPGRVISGGKPSLWDKSEEFPIRFEERNSHEVKA